MAMRVTVCESLLSGVRHGMPYRRSGFRGRHHACGAQEYADILLGHYTDWRERVTCNWCLRILDKLEAKRNGN